MTESSNNELENDLLAPENFSMVEDGVYRSAFPRSKNISFLRRLGLKSVVALIPEDYPTILTMFYKQCGIKLISVGFDGNKWPFKEIDDLIFYKALRDICNPKNRPLLVHCNKGKHRTGSIIGCLRRLRGWSISSTVHEYIVFASPKARLEDQMYIEAFNIDDFHDFCAKNTNNDKNDEDTDDIKEIKFVEEKVEDDIEEDEVEQKPNQKTVINLFNM